MRPIPPLMDVGIVTISSPGLLHTGLEDDYLVRAAAWNRPEELRSRIADGKKLAVTHSLLQCATLLRFTCAIIRPLTGRPAADTALHAAADFGKLEALQVLISAGAPLDSQAAPHGFTPLHYAAEHGRIPIVEALLAAGASKFTEDIDGRRPWHIASNDPRRKHICDLLKDKPSRVTAVALSVANPRDITIRWANMKHGYDQSVIDGFVVEWRQTSTYVINPDFTWLKAFMVPPTKVGVVAPEAAKMIADMEIEPVSVACDLANPRRKEY